MAKNSLVTESKQRGTNLFKPGQSGNPNGRPSLPPEVREERKRNQANLIKLVALYCNLTSEQAASRLASPECLQIEEMIQGMVNRAKEGDSTNFRFLMDIMVGKIPENDYDDFTEEDLRILRRVRELKEEQQKKISPTQD